MQVRKLKIEDAESLLKYFKELVVQDKFRGEKLADVEKFSVESEKSWIKERLDDEVQGKLAARVVEDDGDIIAESEILVPQRSVDTHTGDFRLGILPEKAGLGEDLVKEMLAIAKNQLNLELLHYFHFENQVGVKLLLDQGFQLAGKIPGYYKQSGEYFDRVYLYKNL